jgi:hypothetical protein
MATRIARASGTRIAAGLLIALLLPAAGAAEQSVVGRWYEEARHSGTRVLSIADIKADGTYTVEFRDCTANGPVDYVVAGHWTYANGVFRITKERNGMVYAVDEYRTESNDGSVWEYRIVSGWGFNRYGPVKFRDVKVTAESKLPTCDTLS